jgi:DNA-directed RNA polymerase specialized sigma24 family protein
MPSPKAVSPVCQPSSGRAVENGSAASRNRRVKGLQVMKTKRLLEMYKGAFEDWKAQLALSRIKALGFPSEDWADLMQEAAIVIHEFKYDPEHADGAKEDTALFAAINRHLLSLMRKRCREQDKIERYVARLRINLVVPSLDANATVEPDVALEVDVKHARTGLSEFDQNVCRALSLGLNAGQVARKLDCDWHTVRNAIGRIRRHFESNGLTKKVLS